MNGGLYRANHICPHCFFEHEGGKKSRRAAKPSFVEEAATTSPVTEAAIEAPAAVEEVPTYEPEVAEAPIAEPEKPVVQEVEEVAPEAKAAYEEPKPAEVAEYSAPVEEPAVIETPEAVSAVVEAPAAEPVIEPAEVTLTTKSSAEQNVVATLGDVAGESVITIALTPDMFNAEGKFSGAKSEPVLAALKQGKKNALNNLRDQAALIGANTVADIAIKNGMKLVSAQSANVTVIASGAALVAEPSSELESA